MSITMQRRRSAATARDTALQTVADRKAQLDRWVAKRARAQTDLVALRAGAGAAVLADESAADGLNVEMTRQLNMFEMAAQAIAAAEIELDGARRDAIRAEADEWVPVIARHRQALESHEARTAELLGLLEEHEGRFAPWQPPRAVGSLSYDMSAGPVALEIPKSRLLRQALSDAETTRSVLLAVAAGDDPEAIPGVDKAKHFPGSVWGPDAVLPAPGFLRVRQAHLAALEPARASLAALEREAAALEAQLGAQGNQVTPAQRERVKSLARQLQAARDHVTTVTTTAVASGALASGGEPL